MVHRNQTWIVWAAVVLTPELRTCESGGPGVHHQLPRRNVLRFRQRHLPWHVRPQL